MINIDKIRVLVVDDSYFMRKMISDIILESGVMEVVGTAKDGIDGIKQAKKLAPDVITLDVEMPNMNGIDVLKEIMNDSPIPIIMLSSLTKSGSETTIKALELGAFDFISKPSGSISLDIGKKKKEIIDKIILAYSQKEKLSYQWYNSVNNKINSSRKRIHTDKLDINKNIDTNNNLSKLEGIIAIGTSTGGPKALSKVITNLPKDIPYGILIVQHMPAGFTKSLAERLNSLSEIEVVEAKHNQDFKKGVAYIAPGNYHMTIKKQAESYKILLNQDDLLNGHRPAVDSMYRSLKNINLKKIYVVMTGMGSDGTKGIIEARDEKHDIIIAEDESSCVVYGMPKSVISKGLVDEVVLLENIANSIVESVNKQRRCR